MTCLKTIGTSKKKSNQIAYIPFKFNIILTHPQCTDDAIHTFAKRLMLND